MTIAVVVLATAGLAGALFARTPSEPPSFVVEGGASAAEVADASREMITVHVSGEVVSPGLVSVHAGDRIAHAIAVAGGVLPSADLSGLNLARELLDGDRVVVPDRRDATSPAPASSDSGLIDINRATVAELESLPGVGPVLASRIYDFRNEYGPFDAFEDLLDVPGIGEGKLAALRDAVSLR